MMSAIIAASVALTVFALTQLLGRKRERGQFLTPKLEALYGLVNEVAAWNASMCRLAYMVTDGDQESRKKLLEMDDLELYGHRHAKSIIMYIRLYFPQLSRIHQRLFRAQAELNRAIFELHSDKPPKMEELIKAGGMVGHFLRLMEAEIVNNRDALIRDRFFPKRFKPSTDAEIDAVMPPPEGPVFIRRPAQPTIHT